MNKPYEDMSPAEKKDADRRTRMGGENEARGSADAMRSRGLRPMEKKMDKRGSGKRMER